MAYGMGKRHRRMIAGYRAVYSASPTTTDRLSMPSSLQNPFGCPRHAAARQRRRDRLSPSRARPPGPGRASTGCPSPSGSCSRTPCDTPGRGSSARTTYGSWPPGAAPARRAAKCPSCPPGWSSRTSPACPASWISPRCATRWRGCAGDPDRINPVVPCDLVIDHSVQVDYYGSDRAYQLNVELEMDRNRERYQLLKFAQRAFRNFRVVPARHRHRPPGEPRVSGAGGAAS